MEYFSMGNVIPKFKNDSTADTLRRNIPKILSEWEKRIRSEIIPAEHQKSIVLRNHIPQLLERIANKVSLKSTHEVQESSEEKRRGKTEAQEHGAERASLGQYLLEEVIFEYHILREVIFTVIEEQRPLSPGERDVILNFIEQAVNDTATQFMKSIRSFQEVFLLGIVHDLRGPTNSAANATQLILRDKTGDLENIKKLTSMVHENLMRINRMATDLLDASKAQAGGAVSPSEFTEIEIVELTKDVISDMRDDRIHFSTTASEITGRWSKDSLRRIVENLLGNALKFSDPSSAITVRIDHTDEEVSLSVHNQGAAIPHADRPRLFDQFSRGSQQYAKGGWGIGLVLIKGLVDAHHGTIELESEPNKGTTFIVRLPKRR